MTRFIVRRTLESIPAILGVSILVFLLIHFIPGDPATAILGERATDEAANEIRERLGLNEPLPTQYVIWIGNIMRGDLGTTIRGGVPISQELARRFPATVELTIYALILSTALGIPIGIISALRRNTIVDAASMMVALLGVSIPIFVLGLLLIFLVGVEWELLPFVGRIDSDTNIETITGLYTVDSLLTGNWDGFWDAAGHLVLPAITLMTVPLATTARITRSTMLETLNQDYVRTARAKGLTHRNVILGHALRNALLPIITIVGLQLGRLLSGAVLTETIFSWPGIGKWLFDSITARDYPIVQSVTLIVAVIYVVVNLLVDVMYAFIDPRVRVSE